MIIKEKIISAQLQHLRLKTGGEEERKRDRETEGGRGSGKEVSLFKERKETWDRRRNISFKLRISRIVTEANYLKRPRSRFVYFPLPRCSRRIRKYYGRWITLQCIYLKATWFVSQFIFPFLICIYIFMHITYIFKIVKKVHKLKI